MVVVQVAGGGCWVSLQLAAWPDLGVGRFVGLRQLGRVRAALASAAGTLVACQSARRTLPYSNASDHLHVVRAAAGPRVRRLRKCLKA